jgi:hypothetical protein
MELHGFRVHCGFASIIHVSLFHGFCKVDSLKNQISWVVRPYMPENKLLEARAHADPAEKNAIKERYPI